LPSPKVTVAVPTLAAGDALADCLLSLESQTFSNFEVVVVDNSGTGLAQAAVQQVSGSHVRLIANPRNAGFGAAVNQAFRSSQAPYLATLNDDAVAQPGWLAALVEDAETHPYAGMFASQVRLAGTGTLDSAGMLIAADGSSRQRGHGEAPEKFPESGEALFPSGSAALYRREMLDHAGYFDETYFLYCEDVDLGLRGQWAGWECRYVAGAVAEHRYSHTAGTASPMKAYYVERNRLRTILKNFPVRQLARAPWAALVRYFWHIMSLAEGRGKAAEFRQSGQSGALLPFLVLRAHASALLRLPRLVKERRRIFESRRLTSHEFEQLLARHSIAVRQVAAL
jgi:GT2 family glycosyltransferase